MRFIGLCLLGMLSYLIAMIVLFPAAPVVDYFRPQLGPVALQGVHGKLYKGVIDEARSTDDLLPLEFQNVAWAIAPRTLLNGGAGATIRFDGYGGQGEGQVMRAWDGSIVVTDFRLNVQANELEPLLPVPIASFTGELQADIDRITLVNQLLTGLEGTLTWRDAALVTPVPTALGAVNVVIKPDGEQSHTVTLNATGGDITMDGQVSVTVNGDFAADVLFTPAQNAPAAVINGLRQMGRPDAQGRVRFQRQGNVNRLM